MSSHDGVVAPTRNCISSVELLRTLQLIQAVGTELAFAAHTDNPFDANAITLFPQLFHIVGYCHHDTRSFVAHDSHGALHHLGTKFIVEERFIGSTDTTVIDLAEDLAGSWVLEGKIGDFAFGGLAFAFLHGAFLVGWEMHGW